MKKIIFSLVVTLFFSVVSFAAEDKPHMIRTFDGSKTEKIEVQTSGGYISLLGGNEANARVEVYVKANNWKNKNLSAEELAEKLKQYTISVTQKGNTLECIAKNNNKESNNTLSISFKVFCPKNVDTDLNTNGGSISLSKLSGDLNFKTSGGSLHLKELEGNVLGRTSGGSIDLENCTKNIDLETSGGSVNAQNCSGEIKIKTAGGSFNLDHMKGNISIATSGGSINVNDVNGSLKASTSGGSINIDKLSGKVDAETSGGSIDAQITHLDGEVKLYTSAGSIELKLPNNEGLNLNLEGNKVSTSDLSNFKGKNTAKNVQGSVNGGGHNVSAQSSSGRVSVDF